MSILPPILLDKASHDATWRAEVSAELRHIRESLDLLAHSLHDFRTDINQRLEEHRQYHHQAEPYWGPVRWCERHPFRVAAAAAAAATCATACGSTEWMQALLPTLVSMIT